jgi:hypothetical protein
VALIGHLTHISNIFGRKTDKMISDNLRFSPPKLNGWSPDMMEKIRDKVAGLFRDKLGVIMSGMGQSYWKPYSH